MPITDINSLDAIANDLYALFIWTSDRVEDEFVKEEKSGNLR
jgi:hypothetical protein